MDEQQRNAKLAELGQLIRDKVVIVDGKPVERCDDVYRDQCITLDEWRGV